MKINYTKYRIESIKGQVKNIPFENGEMELQTSACSKGDIRRAFPGFELTHMLSHEADMGIRLHNADWTEGIIVKGGK